MPGNLLGNVCSVFFCFINSVCAIDINCVCFSDRIAFFVFHSLALFSIVLIRRTVMIEISILWTSLSGKILFWRVQNGILQKKNHIDIMQNKLKYVRNCLMSTIHIRIQLTATI